MTIRPSLPAWLLAMALGTAGCPTKTEATKASSSSYVPPLGGSVAPDPHFGEATGAERRHAAVVWLKAYEKIWTPTHAVDPAQLAKLSYPLDKAYSAEKLTDAINELNKLFDYRLASETVVELERQGDDKLASALAKGIATAPSLSESPSELAALSLLDALHGDPKKAMKRLAVSKKTDADAAFRAYLDDLIELGNVDLFLGVLDVGNAISTPTKIWALGRLAREPSVDKALVLDLTKRLDAALSASAADPKASDADKALASEEGAIAEAEMIDALARVGEKDQAQKRVGDVLRFPSKSAPMILDAAARQKLVDRDKAAAATSHQNACALARSLSAVDPKVSNELYKDAEKQQDCISPSGEGQQHFAIADQKRLLAFWQSGGGANGDKALDLLVATILERTDLPLDKEALEEAQKVLRKKPD